MKKAIKCAAFAALLLISQTIQAQYQPWAVQWLQHATTAERGRLYMGVNYTNSFTNYGTITFARSSTNRIIDYTASTNTYEDLVFPAAVLNPPGPVSGGEIVVTSGASGDQLALELDTGEYFWVVVQMSHTWNKGTRVFPHLHIEPQTANANSIVWQVKYSISDHAGTFPADTTVAGLTSVPAGSQWKYLLFNVPTGGIDMTGKTGPSTIIRLNYRAVSVTEPLHIVSFDVHYLVGGSVVPYIP